MRCPDGERDGSGDADVLPAVPQTPFIRVMPYARIREEAMTAQSAGYFDPAVLGFVPSGLSKDGASSARWAVVEGPMLPIVDADDAAGLARGLAGAAAPLFRSTYCRVVVTATRASRLERHLADVLERCGVERRTYLERPGDRRELVVVPKYYQGEYPPEPFLLAARLITALRDRLENATLTGEETVDGALYGCEAMIAVQSDPPGLCGRRHPDVIAVGVAYSF
ncbi:hypothetical protein EPO33_05450 [Patescibacteria group bacterium]|nr:MAG: hypothetical protein EPO33_05450 [Patescibacteria group bacterium]